MLKRTLQSVTGLVPESELGMILPHEHLFTDLRGPETPGYATGDPGKVSAVMLPHLHAAEQAGVTALVECSTLGVGRNVAILQHLANQTRIKIIAPTGVYREAYVPMALRQTPVEELAAMWIRDLSEGMEDTSVKAGFIKIAMSDDGPKEIEVRNLQAAALASRSTSAAVASHTIRGDIAHQEMGILADAGMDLSRFIWVHTQAEPDLEWHLKAVQRGAFVEYDAIGAPYQDQDAMLQAVLMLVEAGYTSQILLSHDAGWYAPGTENGEPEGGVRGFTALTDTFLPALRDALAQRGLPGEIIHQMVHANPIQAFGFLQ